MLRSRRSFSRYNTAVVYTSAVDKQALSPLGNAHIHAVSLCQAVVEPPSLCRYVCVFPLHGLFRPCFTRVPCFPSNSAHFPVLAPFLFCFPVAPLARSAPCDATHVARPNPSGCAEKPYSKACLRVVVSTLSKTLRAFAGEQAAHCSLLFVLQTPATMQHPRRVSSVGSTHIFRAIRLSFCT